MFLAPQEALGPKVEEGRCGKGWREQEKKGGRTGREVVEMKMLCVSLGVTGKRSVRNASEVRGASEMKPESPDWPGYAWAEGC